MLGPTTYKSNIISGRPRFERIGSSSILKYVLENRLSRALESRFIWFWNFWAMELHQMKL